MTDRAGVDPTAALRDLLERIEAGQPLDAALDARPEHAEALRPLLEVAQALRRLPRGAAPVDLAARIDRALAADGLQAPASRAAAAADLADTRPARLGRRVRIPWVSRRDRGSTVPRPALRVASALLACALLLAGAVRASADSLPGAALYPLKRGIERAQLILLPAAREPELALRLAERRLEEAAALARSGRSPRAALAGLTELAPWLAALPAPTRQALESARAAWPGLAPDSVLGPEVAGTPGVSGQGVPRLTPVMRRGPTPELRLARAEATRGGVGTAAAQEAGRRVRAVAPGRAAPTLASAPESTSDPGPGLGSGAEPEEPEVAAPTDPGPPSATPEPEPSPPSPTLPPATATELAPPVTWNRVEGTVASQTGGVVAGAQIGFVDALSGRRVAQAEAGADGGYQLRLQRGRYLAVALADGYQPQWYRGQASREAANPVDLPGDGLPIRIAFRLAPIAPPTPAATQPARGPLPGSSPAPRPTRRPTPSATELPPSPLPAAMR
ncbi:MAG: carboxypeptidase regulatory-like domain-containing protein [Caldilineae bacterium]|nr:carboxypeptidase regulatory-like domain-containing protein [Caldilineae bacterium]